MSVCVEKRITTKPKRDAMRSTSTDNDNDNSQLGDDDGDGDEADHPFQMETIARPINLPQNYTRNSR